MSKRLILVLAFGSVATAGTMWLEVDAMDLQDSYAPSTVITINLVADQALSDFSIGAVTTDNGGTAQAPLYLDPGLTFLPLPGTIINSGGILIEYAGGAVAFLQPSIAAGTTIWSFDFHVPELPESSIIIIDDLIDAEHQPNPYLTSASLADGVIAGMGGVEIHVDVPEPATICLLGLGALSLIRRRRKTA